MTAATTTFQTNKKPVASKVSSLRLSRSGNLLQRKCACGGTPGPGGECEECRKKRLQRKGVQVSTLAPQHEQESGIKEKAAIPEASRGVSWNFSKIPLLPLGRTSVPRPSSPLATVPLPGVIQAKLVVGQSNDPFEYEADRVADQVMRMPDPAFSIAPARLQLSRKCSPCEAEDEKKPQTKPAGTPGAAGRKLHPIVHEVLRSPGRPLDAATRAFFEPRFGYEFSAVKVHSDGRAATSARSVGALAYTIGPHIAFAPGYYSPDTASGQRLLAHELVHVIQQKGLQRGNARASPTIQRQDDTQAIGPGNELAHVIQQGCNTGALARSPSRILQRQNDEEDGGLPPGGAPMTDQAQATTADDEGQNPDSQYDTEPVGPGNGAGGDFAMSSASNRVISGNGPTMEAACDAAKQNCQFTCGSLPAQIGTCNCYASGYISDEPSPGFTCDVTCECSGKVSGRCINVGSGGCIYDEKKKKGTKRCRYGCDDNSGATCYDKLKSCGPGNWDPPCDTYSGDTCGG